MPERQAFELDDLAVIYKEIYFRAIVFDIPSEDIGSAASNIGFSSPRELAKNAQRSKTVKVWSPSA
jgi:hypothetical protein